MAKHKIFEVSLRVFKEKAKARLEEAAQILHNKIVENATLVDHTLKDLAKLGHPYSVKNPNNPHSPEYLIHEQTGNLKGNIEIARSEKGFKISVGVDSVKVPYIAPLILGTARMIPRDFLTGSFDEVLPEIRKVFERK